jgi:hypothetical protein
VAARRVFVLYDSLEMKGMERGRRCIRGNESMVDLRDPNDGAVLYGTKDVGVFMYELVLEHESLPATEDQWGDGPNSTICESTRQRHAGWIRIRRSDGVFRAC